MSRMPNNLTIEQRIAAGAFGEKRLRYGQPDNQDPRGENQWQERTSNAPAPVDKVIVRR